MNIFSVFKVSNKKTKSQEEVIKKLVWDKARIISGYDPKRIRKDLYGAWICFDAYNQRDSEYGWEVDSIEYGLDSFSNMIPMQWKNKKLRRKGAKRKSMVVGRGMLNMQ